MHKTLLTNQLSGENWPSDLVVMEIDTMIVGCGYAQIRESKSCHLRDNHCYLGFIYLELEHRGKSLGKEIVETLKTWGIEKGIKNVLIKRVCQKYRCYSSV